MKKLIAMLLALAMMLCLAACVNSGSGDGETTYAIVPKSSGNPYNEREASGFEDACKALGVKCETVYPEDTSAEAQIQVIETLIAKKVAGIAVAANDSEALESTLKKARDAGIVVVTLDSDAKGSQLFVNQAGVTEVAQKLVDSVYDMTGGEGEFAVLSATSTATNQNAWIAAMEQIIKADEKYSKLNWVETVYGDDESQKSVDQTNSLLTNYPNLEVICCPTTVGILACAQTVETTEGCTVKVAGLGLPSEMNGHVGDDKSCPYMYLWNPIDVGATAAYAIKAIIDQKTTGAVGEEFEAENGNKYTVIAADESVGVYSTQIIVGPPYEFTSENIEEWSKVY